MLIKNNTPNYVLLDLQSKLKMQWNVEYPLDKRNIWKKLISK